MRLALRISLAACVLLLSGCARKQPPPTVVTPPLSTLVLRDANRAYAMGDYLTAGRDFERYLQLVPSGGDRDQAMFHLGLIYSLPEEGRQDWTRASGYLKNLTDEFPQSTYKPAAQLILSMRDQAALLSAEIAKLTAEGTQLRSEGLRLRNEVTALQNDAAQLRSNSSLLSDQVIRLKAEADQVAVELARSDQRIRQLNTELERLIRIDSERRTRPNENR